jgi:ElaB/YqjD/DUF883 family membrane-anchored ribosome-binding protein
MKSNHETTTQTPKELLNDLHTLVAEAEKMMGESISEHTGDAVSALRERFDTAHERLSELYEGAKKKVVAGAKCTDAAIRANPYQSLAITAGVAVGVGLLVGVLIGRNTK